MPKPTVKITVNRIIVKEYAVDSREEVKDLGIPYTNDPMEKETIYFFKWMLRDPELNNCTFSMGIWPEAYTDTLRQHGQPVYMFDTVLLPMSLLPEGTYNRNIPSRFLFTASYDGISKMVTEQCQQQIDELYARPVVIHGMPSSSGYWGGAGSITTTAAVTATWSCCSFPK